jgi:hypothetical protein
MEDRLNALEEKVRLLETEIKAESAARVTRCKGLDKKIDTLKKK